MKKVGLIIVNYNGQKYLPQLLGSIFNYQPQTIWQEVIVIDNASTDNSIHWLKSNYAAVKLIESKTNLGFAAGNNLGFKYCLERNFDYAMLLNQDTLITAGYLDILVNALERNLELASVQPLIKLYPETNLINSYGNVIHYLGFGYTFGHKRSANEFQLKNRLINYAAGAACLYRLSTLKEIGFFNEEFFMYHEDLDLGWRFKMRGYQNAVIPEAIVYHQYEFSRSIKKYYFMERNRYLTIFQNYHWLTLALLLPALILMEAGLLIFAAKGGWLLEKLKVYAYFLNPVNWQKLLRQRKYIQKLRKVSERKIIKSFAGSIIHQEVNNPLVEKIANPFFNAYWQIIKHLIVW